MTGPSTRYTTMTTSLITRRNIGIAAVIVFVVFLVVMTMDGNQHDRIQPTLKAIKNHLYKSRDKFTPANPDLEKLRLNGMVTLPEKKVLKTMSTEALFKTYHSYLDNVDIGCNRKLRMGAVGDGGWEVCDDEKYRPSRNCVAFSFGINNDFSFDDDIARVYQCSVIAFDPSMKSESHQRSPLVYFLRMGIAERNYDNPEHWKLRTLGYFLKEFNYTNRVIDVLKMDVENAEWVSLPEMIDSGHLRQVKQLLLEYHSPNQTELVSQLSILKDIHDLGFRKFYVHKNFHCAIEDEKFPVKRTACNEVHYVNVNLL